MTLNTWPVACSTTERTRGSISLPNLVVPRRAGQVVDLADVLIQDHLSLAVDIVPDLEVHVAGPVVRRERIRAVRVPLRELGQALL